MSALRGEVQAGEYVVTGTFRLSPRALRRALRWMNAVSRGRGGPTISKRRLQRLAGRAKGQS